MTDTGPAKLPGLPALKTSDQAMQRWAQAVAEHLEVRAGARGNPAERGVTQRDLLEATRGLDDLRSDKSAQANAGDLILNLGGGMTVAVAIDRFANSIFDSPLYKNLMKRVDDLSRFDDVPEAVRKLLLVNIAEEAARRGADIVRLDKKIQTSTESLAYTITEVTAAIQGVSAGVRETTWASANANLATAGRITQVQSRLDNFAGGGPGVATLEQKMSTIASNVTGLSAEYSVKVQAGGIFGSFGIAAYLPADPTKPAYSMFLIAADKFGLVFPGNDGSAAAANLKRVPFGIDVNGIYMNSDVYIKGTMRVDTGGSTLSDGLRGSLHLGITGAWSDAAARNAIYSTLGKGASAPDNAHLVIGDSITASSGTSGTTKYWNGYAWAVPGVVISGDMVLDGSLSATKLITSELRIPWSTGVTGFVGSTTDKAITTAQSTADSALLAANAASGSQGMSASAKNVLTGVGGIKVGSIDWDANGNTNTGIGVGITQQGIAARNAAGPSFVLDGTTGKLTINQISVINTLQIAGSAVTIIKSYAFTGKDFTSPGILIPAGIGEVEVFVTVGYRQAWDDTTYLTINSNLGAVYSSGATNSRGSTYMTIQGHAKSTATTHSLTFTRTDTRPENTGGLAVMMITLR